MALPSALLPNMIRPKPSNTIAPAGTRQLWAASDTWYQVILRLLHAALQRGVGDILESDGPFKDGASAPLCCCFSCRL